MKLPASTATVGLSVLLLAAALPAQTAGTVSATASVSKVRIVRLSEVKGSVELDRSNGRGLEPAITNLPIVEQNRLQTGTGVAEVEFEDNSSMRLAPNSAVEFTELSRTQAGTTVSSVHVLKGMAYLTLVKSRGNEFNLLVGDHKIAVPPATHLRLQVNDNDAKIAVLDGALTVDSPHGPVEVSKKKTLTLLTADDIDPTVAKAVVSDPFDSWDKQAADYHARVAASSAFGGSPYSYGMSDMMYYGSFANVAGCGSMWRPYFTSAAWDPYSAGSWAYYSGAGYSWVSPYPWGWTPYHYGSWSYCPNAGWGWQPGGTWTGLNNGSMMASNPANGNGSGKMRIPVVPAQAPRAGEPTMVAVISKPVVRSEMSSARSFVFRNDSAGLGVPRGELGGLNKFSEHTVQRGSASTEIYTSVSASAGSGGVRPAAQSLGVMSVHRGSPPPPSSSNESAFSGGSPSYGASSSSSNSVSSSNSAPRPSPAPAPSGGRPR
jgi:hypothetical protein